MSLYLGDTSAWHRTGVRGDIARWWSELIARGELAVSPPVTLELLYSARGPSDYAMLRDELLGLPSLALSSDAISRAQEVMDRLAARSQHRGPRPMDLFIAAVAEINSAMLVHYDRHFDAIARITGQPMRWLAPRGALG